MVEGRAVVVHGRALGLGGLAAGVLDAEVVARAHRVLVHLLAGDVEASGAERVDVRLLAAAHELTGAQIRNAVFRAAFRASRSGEPVSLYLLEQAARLALDLGEPDMALGWTQELERLAMDGEGQETAGALGSEARSGLLLREDTVEALGRARLAVILGALLALLGAALSLGGPRSRPS